MDRPWLKFYEPGVPHHIQYPDIPLYRILDDAVRDFPENEAIIFQGRGITYRELGEEVTHVASGLAQMGLKKGQRMAIMLPIVLSISPPTTPSLKSAGSSSM